MKTLRVPAFAKVNLGLEVLRAREDGYHELRTIFQTLDLHDEIVLRPHGSTLSVRCDHPEVPLDASNLAVRAAEELRHRAGVGAGIEIRIRKRIPVMGGLGGGSSDAAAVLLGLDRLWGLRLGPAGLEPLARRLGADVPYFLVGGTALGVGRGDEVYPLRDQVRAFVVLVDPGLPLSTRAVFRRVAARLTPRENGYTIHRFVARDFRGRAPYRVLTNELEAAALEEAPALRPRMEAIRRVLVEGGALLASMSGSGSTCFGLFEARAGAARASLVLRRLGFRPMLTRTVTLDDFRRAWRRALAGAPGGHSRG
jgi:4-diphosphocytidyl-2-C-methyl-D-erythritol kinase